MLTPVNTPPGDETRMRVKLGSLPIGASHGQPCRHRDANLLRQGVIALRRPAGHEQDGALPRRSPGADVSNNTGSGVFAGAKAKDAASATPRA